ncbi:MAG: PRC-barrel domain-containing protein [Anaerolineales bacterium]
MQLKKGAAVESSTGEKIGRLSAVVLDHETKEISHIIIEKGLLLTTNKVVYIQDVRTIEDDGRVILYKTAQELEDAPTYDPDSYVHLKSRGAFWRCGAAGAS